MVDNQASLPPTPTFAGAGLIRKYKEKFLQYLLSEAHDEIAARCMERERWTRKMNEKDE